LASVVIVVIVVLVVLGGHEGESVMEHGILFIVPLYGIYGVIGGAWWWDCRRHGSDKAGPPNTCLVLQTSPPRLMLLVTDCL
jgi:hypothetical protein